MEIDTWYYFAWIGPTLKSENVHGRQGLQKHGGCSNGGACCGRRAPSCTTACVWRRSFCRTTAALSLRAHVALVVGADRKRSASRCGVERGSSGFAKPGGAGKPRSRWAGQCSGRHWKYCWRGRHRGGHAGAGLPHRLAPLNLSRARSVSLPLCRVVCRRVHMMHTDADITCKFTHFSHTPPPENTQNDMAKFPVRYPMWQIGQKFELYVYLSSSGDALNYTNIKQVSTRDVF